MDLDYLKENFENVTGYPKDIPDFSLKDNEILLTKEILSHRSDGSPSAPSSSQSSPNGSLNGHRALPGARGFIFPSCHNCNVLISRNNIKYMCIGCDRFCCDQCVIFSCICRFKYRFGEE